MELTGTRSVGRPLDSEVTGSSVVRNSCKRYDKERIINDFTSIGYFDNSFESDLIIIKSMLEEAVIKYFIKNENRRSISPIIMNVDSGVAMELYVDTHRLKEAKEIYHSIIKG